MHAVFATTAAGVTFRIGQPTSWEGAQARWLRLANLHRNGRKLRVRHARRWYAVRFYEVRSVDAHGRALDTQPRHAHAVPVPYRAHRVVPA
jgi:hypothetical protein